MPTKKTHTKIVEETLKYTFTEKENLENGRRLGEAHEELQCIQDDKKRLVDEFKAKESAKDAEITSLSGKVRSGYEYRPIKCEVTYNDPKVGIKTLRRLDTMEVVWQREMTEDEKQLGLDLES